MYQTNSKTKYSQSDEEIFIVDRLKDIPNGKFLDVGAYDTFRFSNTRKLFEMGWSGCLIEPAPKNYAAIAEHYANEPRVEVLNFAVGEPAGEIEFYESDGDAVSTSSIEHMEKWSKGGVNYTKIKVPQIGVVDFFNKYGHDVDMMSLDTEATNMIIFRLIPSWFWERVRLVVIEHDNCQEEIETTLNKYGLETLHINNENIILGK